MRVKIISQTNPCELERLTNEFLMELGKFQIVNILQSESYTGGPDSDSSGELYWSGTITIVYKL